jgi:drug/metabolite transporter (DMT)-like permease
MVPRPLAPYLVLTAGVVVVSTASILIRFAQGEGVPSLTIAAVRLSLAALILTPIVWARSSHELSGLRHRDLALALLSGVFLAVHFWSWIASLAYTSVASSTALVTTNPLWVGLASVLILGEGLGGRIVTGIALTLAGSVLIFVSDSSSLSAAHRSYGGNLLALLGAVAKSGYHSSAELCARIGTRAIWLIWFGGIFLLLGTVATGQSLAGYRWPMLQCWLALGPQLYPPPSIGRCAVSATFGAVSIGSPSALRCWRY